MDGARQSPTSDGLTNEPTDKVNSRICKSVESSVVLPLQQVSSGTSTTKGTNRKKNQTNQKPLCCSILWHATLPAIQPVIRNKLPFICLS